MIRILVVDDSETVRQLLVHEIDRQTDMKVVGVAANGIEAIRQAEKLRPDVITMDIQMPLMDGLEATREIMCTRACPIIIVSQHWNQNDKQKLFEALETGAIAMVNKPAGPGHPEYDESVACLLKTIRMMSEIKVITRRRTSPASKKIPLTRLKNSGVTCPPPCRTGCPIGSHCGRVIVIGASTGGPVVLREIFERIPAPYGLPILVVQHIAPGFLSGLVDWLSNATGHVIEIAQHGKTPEAGHIYFAPDDQHMGLAPNGSINLSNDPKEHSLRPAVSYLFRSVAKNAGETAIGVLLTGMGADGAKELKLLKDAGAATVIQNQASCVVFGMPGEALKLDAARHILPPDEIAGLLTHAVHSSQTTETAL